MNSRRERTWKASPATIMCTPVFDSFFVLAVSAIAPPAACRTKEMKSQNIKVIEMVFGESQEYFWP